MQVIRFHGMNLDQFIYPFRAISHVIPLIICINLETLVVDIFAIYNLLRELNEFFTIVYLVNEKFKIKVKWLGLFLSRKRV